MPDSRPLTRPQVADTLRRLREAVGLSKRAAGLRVGLQHSTIKRYEDGAHVPDHTTMLRLVDVYRPDPGERAALLASAREHQGGKQQQVVMHDAATTATNRITKAEKAAVKVTAFSPLTVPGLVQAPAYLRAVGLTALSGAKLDSWLAARRKRQQQMWDSTKTEYAILTTAAALTLALGGADVMLEQIEHLADITAQDRVRFGIVPAAAPIDRYVLHGFDVLEQPDGTQLVHYGTHSGVVTVTDPAEQQELLAVLAEVERAAVSGEHAQVELQRLAALYG